MTAPLRLWRPERPPRGRVRRDSDATVAAMRAAGRLDKVDAALVVAVRVAADNVDTAERERATAYVVAAALRVYLVAVAALYARVGLTLPVDDDEVWRDLSGPLEHTATA